MPMRLINPDEEKCIEIEGTKIYYRQLNGRDKALLGVALSKVNLHRDMNDDKASMMIAEALPEIEPILSRNIIRTDNPVIEPSKLLERIADTKDYMLVAFGIFNSSAIGEGESKNSGCSSSSSGAKEAGTVRAATTENGPV